MTLLFQRLSQPATLTNVSELRRALGKSLQRENADTALINKIQLCFSEAATNLIEHSMPPPKHLDISLARSCDGWQLKLEDDGQSWDPTAVNSQHLDTSLDFALDLESEHGRGIALIRAQSSSQHYATNHALNRNCLTLGWHTIITVAEETNASSLSLRHKPRVLLVEDDASQMRLLRAYLCNDYHILEAQDGIAALTLLKEHRVELVISDIRMPGMDGLSLKKALHAQTDTLLTPFIFLTSAHSSAIKASAADLGIDDYLIKPVQKAELIQSIQRVLQRSEQVFRQLTDKIDQRISQALTPSLPSSAFGWELAIASRNTGIGGGDLALFHQHENKFILGLIDVMGHDVAAKFFSYAYGGYIRGLMHHLDKVDDPCATMLAQLSDSLSNDVLLSQLLLTCCAVTLYPNGQFDIASAGHPAPRLISSNGSNALNVGGILPGMLVPAHYQTYRSVMTKDARIALFTDGLFEAAENRAQRAALELAIIKELERTHSLPLADALHHVMRVFDKQGEWHRDDATLILLQHRPL
ncbi:response regulator [Vibrio sp. SM6]|uniref:Response regulator n=1 Tax=Vibrio agarilyticus TaxID=2726741 RepID=A0A7X8TQJ8_9VIBR|nr:SpoIIE family protein phosphatase [Vibrio agarilyticus]NLS12914.1 response regulator [Vibrio agarilyticus]